MNKMSATGGVWAPIGGRIESDCAAFANATDKLQHLHQNTSSKGEYDLLFLSDRFLIIFHKTFIVSLFVVEILALS